MKRSFFLVVFILIGLQKAQASNGIPENPRCEEGSTSSTVVLTWDAVPGAISYDVTLYVYDPECCRTGEEGTPAAYVAIFSPTTNSLNVSLASHPCFSWQVRSVSAGNVPSGYTESRCGCETIPCTTFNDEDLETPAGDWRVSPINPSGISLVDFSKQGSDGTTCVTLYDDDGPSFFSNSVAYNDLGQRFPENHCLCFEIRLDHSDPPNPPDYPYYPKLWVRSGLNIIYFESNIGLTAPSSWVKICAPIALASGGALPAVSNGRWHMSPGMSGTDFSYTMNNVDEIWFSTDITGEQNEIIQLDNICVEHCDEKIYWVDEDANRTQPNSSILNNKSHYFEKTDNRLLLYPNPTDGVTKLELNIIKETDLLIEVVDMNGRTVLTPANEKVTSGTYKFTINTETLSTGLYNVKVQTTFGTQLQLLSVTK